MELDEKMSTEQETPRKRSGQFVIIILLSLVTLVGTAAFFISKNMPMKQKKREDPAYTQLERLNAELKSDVQSLAPALQEATQALSALRNANLPADEKDSLCAALSSAESPPPTGAGSQLLRNIEKAREKARQNREARKAVQAKLDASRETMDGLVKKVKRDGRLVRDDPYAEPSAKSHAAHQRHTIDDNRARSEDLVIQLSKEVSVIDERQQTSLDALESGIRTLCAPVPPVKPPVTDSP